MSGGQKQNNKKKIIKREKNKSKKLCLYLQICKQPRWIAEMVAQKHELVITINFIAYNRVRRFRFQSIKMKQR